MALLAQRGNLNKFIIYHSSLLVLSNAEEIIYMAFFCLSCLLRGYVNFPLIFELESGMLMSL